jgi:polysaccharide chain length determinant protein (PEP-CTERM system associated)
MNATAEAILPREDSPIGERLAEQIDAIVRRRLPMAAAFGSVLALALLLALLLPATYRSTGIVLIEQQEIPEDVIRSAVSSFADQRVQMISQRVMTSTNLLEIIDKHRLYEVDRKSTPREKLIERIRRDIHMDMISADVVDPRRGGVVKATIAFSVAFENSSPKLASRVANDLVSLFLRENLETRKQLAAGSAEFLASEAERLRKRTQELEQTIARFKRDNLDRLPETSLATTGQLARISEELREVDTRIRSFDQQIVFLDSQLVQISPTADVVTEKGERLASPTERLRLVRAQFAAASARYSPSHPDVRRLSRELTKLEEEVARAGPAAAEGRSAPAPDNPAYLQISAQRTAAVAERSTLRERRAELQGLVAGLEQAQLEMPEVDREYRAMLLEAQAEQQKYAEVRQKQLAAQLSQNLESEQKGERFTLIDPPVVPEEPISPNRPLIAVIGLVLAVGAAAAVLFLMEALDTRVHGARQVLAVLGEPPLVVVPWVAPDPGPARRRVDWRWLTAGAALVLAAALVLTHIFVKPLDVVWALALRRLGG